MPTSSPRTEDHALLARIATGDRVALEQLYRRHARWLTARLQARCGDPDLADLAVQDTFLAVWTSARRFRGEGDVGAWIWGIGSRRLIDQLRRRRTDPLDPSVVTAALDSDERIAASPSGEDALLATSGEAVAALSELEPDLRAVFVLTVLDGLSTKDVARVLGIPNGTVKTRAMRARQRLRDALPPPATPISPSPPQDGGRR